MAGLYGDGLYGDGRYDGANAGTQSGAVQFDLTIDYATLGAGVANGLYPSLMFADRPVAWWGVDVAPLDDDSGHGYSLTVNGGPTQVPTLLTHGSGAAGGARDFNGSTDVYWTLGTLYQAPKVPPFFHSATATAGATDTAKVTTPNGIEAGDLVLAVLLHSNNTATISSTPAGWTQVGTTLNATSCAVAVFKKLPSADEPANEHAWVWSVAGTTLNGCLVYRNCDQSVSGLIFDSGQQVTASGNFHQSTTETNPIQAHALAIWAAETTGSIVPNPTGLNSRLDVAAANMKLVAAEYDIAAAGSTYNTAATTTNTPLGSVLLTFGSPNDVLEDGVDAISSNVSIAVLINPDTVAAGTRTIIRKHQSWGVHLNAATVEFVYRDGAGVDRVVTGPTVSASATTHLVVADDGTNINFYKNGVKTSSARLGSAGYTQNLNRVTIGAYHNGTSFTNFWDGRIDEPAIFAACVSDDMVAAWYQAHSLGTFGKSMMDLTDYSLPRIKVEIAFASKPTDNTFIWRDVTADLRSEDGITAQTCNRNFELDRMQSGRLDFTLNNRTRKYDTTYASGPFYPNVIPTRPVRLRAQAQQDGTAYELFFGYTEGHPQLRTHDNMDAVAQFTATDVFKALSLDKVLGNFVRPTEFSGARLQSLIDGLPGVLYSGEAGQSLIIGDDLNGVNTLDHAQQVAETEGGLLFADGHGRVRFQDRQHRVRFERTVRVTYSDAAGAAYRLKAQQPLIDEARLFTSASVTPASGNPQRVTDVAASAQHFVRTKELTTLHASDNDALAMANMYATRYSTPRERIPAVTLQPLGAPDPKSMWDMVLSHEISHRIATTETPIGDVSAVTREHFIEGITHAIGKQDWIVDISVSPAALEGEYLIVGTGVVDDPSGADSGVIGW